MTVMGVAACLALLLSVIGSSLYLRDVRHGGTRPHRGSWLVWSVIALVAATSQGSSGGGWSLVVLWGQALSAPKTWLDPYSETLATYALAGATGLLAALAVRAWDPGVLLYPVYFCLGNGSTAVLIAARRRSSSTPPRPLTRPRTRAGRR